MSYTSPIYNVMPTAPPPLKVFAAAAPMRCSSGKASICVLDDDPSMLKAVERLLKAEGFVVEKFSDPATFACTLCLALGRTKKTPSELRMVCPSTVNDRRFVAPAFLFKDPEKC